MVLANTISLVNYYKVHEYILNIYFIIVKHIKKDMLNSNYYKHE